MPPQPWPAELPQQFDKDGYQDTFEDNRFPSQTDLGPALIRTRYSNMPRRLSGNMKMTKPQLDRLRKFWVTDTLHGKLPFLFPDPIFGYGPRMNYIPNSGYAGGVVGNPGTPPNGWSGAGVQNGISVIIGGMGVEGDLQYVDLHFAGTPTGSGIAEMNFASNVPATSGQTWTESAYVRMVYGSKINLISTSLIMYNLPAPLLSYGTDFMPKLSPSELIYQRYSNTWTPASTGMNGVSARLQVKGTVGIFIDITLRVAGIQLEKADKPSAFMPTPNTANPITRFAAGGRPPSPVFLGGETWGVQMDMEIFEA